MSITSKRTRSPAPRARAWLVALSVGVVSGCATEVDDLSNCDGEANCNAAYEDDEGPAYEADEVAADDEEELGTSQQSMASGGYGGGGDCAIMQCNGLVNPFGTLACRFGYCICVGNNGKAGVCKPGKTVCSESCTTGIAPGGVAP